jgi:type II secretory pathway component PulF
LAPLLRNTKARQQWKKFGKESQMLEPLTLLLIGGIIAMVAVGGSLRPLSTDKDPFYV